MSAALGRSPPAPPSAPLPSDNESHGRANASYASSQPRAVAPAYLSAEADPSMPAVIVNAVDTLPSAPPRNMTTPIGAVPHTAPLGVGHAHGPAMHGVPHAPASAMRPSHPPAPASSPYGPPGYAAPPFTPPPFPAHVANAAPRPHVAHPTMRMAEAPRRPRTPTVVLREQGPSTAQKLAAFMAMLVFVTGCGIAVIVWRRPAWLGLVPPAPPAPVMLAPAAPAAPAR